MILEGAAALFSNLSKIQYEKKDRITRQRNPTRVDDI